MTTGTELIEAMEASAKADAEAYAWIEGADFLVNVSYFPDRFVYQIVRNVCEPPRKIKRETAIKRLHQILISDHFIIDDEVREKLTCAP